MFLRSTTLPLIPESTQELQVTVEKLKFYGPLPQSKSKMFSSNTLSVITETVRIRRNFKKPRIGVRTTEGITLGFVFYEISWTVHQLRDAIDVQVRIHFWEIASTIKFAISIDLLSEMVGQSQSSKNQQLILIDVLIGHHVCLEFGDYESNNSRIRKSLPAPLTVQSSLPDSCYLNSPTMPPPTPSFQLSAVPTFGQETVKDFERKKVEKDMGVAKPILISYVRAESAQNALEVKKELTDLGFSVYLVKLADVLGKFIIPINFTENWPPECLAIQFASTQYIQWRIQSDIDQGDGRLDTQDLDRVSGKRVSREIAERCKVYKKKNKTNLRLMNRKSTAIRSPSEDGPPLVMDSLPEEQEKNESSSDKPLVIISVHPKQQALAHELKTVLEDEGYRVWNSLEVCEENIINDIRHTSHDSGESLTQAYHDINLRIAESKSKDSSAVTWADQSHGCPAKLPLTSQISLISQVSSLTPEKIERLRCFQQKADEAAIVVVVVSCTYTNSKTSQQQVYYCEQRKNVIAVKYDQSDVPGWFQMLLGNDMIKNISSPQFMDTFKARVKRAIDPLSSSPPKDGTTEVKIQYLVNFLHKNIPTVDDSYVYITGSTKLASTRSEDICKAIGQKLALSGDLNVITGGYYGAAEIVAQSYVNQKKSSGSTVFHLLPMKDASDLSSKTRQNADGSFQPVPFGKTIFLGDSIKERELASARLLSTCILIEGGRSSAHQAEQFIWNDHNVIPIISTGGAAGGDFGIPAKVFEVPAGVSQKDWNLLSKIDASADVVADAIIRIIRCLKKACSGGSPNIDRCRKPKSKLKHIGKSNNINESQTSLFDDAPSQNHKQSSGVKKFFSNIAKTFKR
ncbi:hypothetical protein GQR58_021785 [Nymphon striatum]|nr:hypothetical protein GQR58_021785 [Nymphon striatum]